jgi:anti-anti-sigma factor
MQLNEGSPFLHLDVHREGTRTILGFEGELDAHAGRDLAQRCRARLSGHEHEVVVELGRVEFADVAGVCALAAVAREVLDGGVHVVLRDASPMMSRLLALTSVGHLIRVPDLV